MLPDVFGQDMRKSLARRLKSCRRDGRFMTEK
jgi:hypothetical protein